MTITPIPVDGFPRTGRPWNNITPFTYRDGLTYLEVLEALRYYVREVLVSHVNKEMNELAESWDVDNADLVNAVNAALAEQADIVNAAVEELLSGSIEVNDTIVNAIISDFSSDTREALNAIIGSEILRDGSQGNSAVDPVVSALIDSNGSSTRGSVVDVIGVELNQRADPLVSSLIDSASSQTRGNLNTAIGAELSRNNSPANNAVDPLVADIVGRAASGTRAAISTLVSSQVITAGTPIQGAVDTRIQAVAADIIANDPTLVDAAVLAMTEQAVIEQLSFVKGILPDGTDLHTLTEPGMWRLTSSFQYVNMPPFTRPGANIGGFVTVTNTPGNSWPMVEVVRYGNSYERFWMMSTNTTGGRSKWVRVNGSDIIRLWDGADADELTDISATYAIETTTVADSSLNFPANYPGFLDVTVADNGLVKQEFTPYASQMNVYIRTTQNLTRGTLTAWQPLMSVANDEATGGTFRHLDLLSRAKARRGGRIGTGGKAAVSIRFDHHWDTFNSKVLPLLDEYAIPWAQATNPDRLGTGDDNVTFGEIQQTCLDYGGEILNHSATHGDAVSEAAIEAEVVGSLQALQTGLPQLVIDGWAPPGLAAGGYAGAAPFRTVEQNSGTFAGRMITDHHAFVAGYADGTYRLLDPTVENIGARHVTLDSAAVSTINNLLNGAEANGAGVALMLHPNMLDEPDRMSTADLEAVLQNIAARRDAGTIAVVSYTGMFVSDIATEYRHDLMPSTASAEVQGDRTESVTVYRREHLIGSTRELLIDVSTDAGATISVTVGTGRTTTHTAQAGQSTIRRMVTTPYGVEDPITVSLTGTGTFTTSNIRLLAV